MSEYVQVGAEIQLLYDTVVNLNDLAENSYTEAKRNLDALAAGVTDLPLTLVDTDIGTSITLTWTGTITPITASTAPTFLEDYLATLPTTAPTVPETTVTLTELTATPPTIAENETPGAPTAIGTLEFDALPAMGTLPELGVTLPTMGVLPTIDGTLPVMGALPTIDTVIPVISLSALDTEFAWNEPEYIPEVKQQIKCELLRVLGGDLGLPQWYWESLWTESANDLARQQVGRLRNARSRGAASFWALPSETTLAASRAIQDEGAKSLQINRLKQAQTQATMAREDFWQAVEKGIAFEQQWINVHEQLAARSLAAAETLVNLRINAHNANVAYYTLLLEAAKTEVEIDKTVIDAVIRVFEGELKGVQIGADIGKTITDAVIRTYEGELKGAEIEAEIDKIIVDAVLRTYEGQLKGSAMDIEQVKARIDKYQAEWAAKNTREKTLVEVFGESVRAWGTQIDGEIKAARFPLDKAEIESRVHGTLFGAVGALASATNAIIQGDVESKKAVLAGEVAVIDQEKAKNLANIEVGKLTQAAQEAKARIDVAQAQWIEGQAQELTKRIAELAYGYAQAAVAASDVSYGRNINASNSYGETASHNAEKVW